MLLLGLSHKNLERLKNNEPIGIDPAEIKLLTKHHGSISGIILFAGATEADIKGWMVANGFFGEGTEEYLS